MAGLITRNSRMEIARSIYRDMVTGRDNWFVFGARTMPWDEDPVQPTNSWKDIAEAHRNIIFTRKIKPEEVVFMARRVNWESGKVFDMYDNSDPNLFDKDFYMVTSANRVYKCIYNGGGRPSYTEPTAEEPIELIVLNEQDPDGAIQNQWQYVWKFMFKILPDDVNKFMTLTHFPVRYYSTANKFNVNGFVDTISVTNAGQDYSSNPAVLIEGDGSGAVAQATVVAGAITAVTVLDGGSNYSFAKATIVDTVGSGATLSVNLMSTDLESNPDQPNQLVATQGAIPGAIQAVVIDNPGSGYVSGATQIEIVGDGSDAAISATIKLGEIRSVQILSEGEGYTFAEVNVSGSGTGAVIRPIVSPLTGHGSNAPQELGASIIGINTLLDDAGVFENNDYYQFGLVKNLELSNGSLLETAIGNACYIVEVSSTNFVNFNNDDIIKSTAGGEFVVVQKKVVGDKYEVWLQDIIPAIDASSMLYNETTQNSTLIAINKLTHPTFNKRSGEIVFVQSIESQNRDPLEDESFKIYMRF